MTKTFHLNHSPGYYARSVKFGGSSDDVHQMSGSMYISGTISASHLYGSGRFISGVITADAAGSDTQFQYNDGGATLGAVTSLAYNNSTRNITITEDIKLYFGTSNDTYIQYNEGTDDYLAVSGSKKGIVLSGSRIQIDGTLVGVSPLLVLSGSDEGIVLSGSAVKIDSYLGVGVNLEADAITHGITLPNTASNAGTIQATSYVTYSSTRYKTNVEIIKNPIEKISQIHGVTYNWKNNDKKEVGFIAEEVGKVIPEIVEWEPNTDFARSMDYTRITPVILEAVKIQQLEIENMKIEINILKDELKRH